MLRKIGILLIKFYKNFISPLLPHSCRFYPTCSTYALISIEKFGFIKGGFLAIRRILRCHPFNPGGYDPVPEVYIPIRLNIKLRRKEK
ncbi:MAG: membrane protein insertion efficiency factor YidD [Dictyoglomaceae bacterium]